MRAQAALLRARRRVRTEPIGSFTSRGPDAAGVVRGDPVRAREIALAVERAAAHGLFRPYCLVQALALRELLTRHGIDGSQIRIGVRQNGGKFSAHAWVRWGQEILGDRADHVAGFTEVDDIRVLQGL